MSQRAQAADDFRGQVLWHCAFPGSEPDSRHQYDCTCRAALRGGP
jgi:hypothetical protein